MILILRSATSFIQYILFLYLAQKCLKLKNSEITFRIRLRRMLLYLFFFELVYFLSNTGVTNVLISNLILWYTCLFYFDDEFKNIISCISVFNLAIYIPAFLFGILAHLVIIIGNIEYMLIIINIFMYVFLNIWILMYIRYIHILEKAYRCFSINNNYKLSSYILITLGGFFEALIISFGRRYIWEGIFIIYFLTSIVLILYIIKMKKQNIIISELNSKIELKNTELRKIKHDYGAQISYLYGMYLLKRFDDLKKEVSSIRMKSEKTPSAVELNYSTMSNMDQISKVALDRGVHVIINDYGDMNNIKIRKEELIHIIKRIVNTLIDVINHDNFISIKTYNSLGKLEILIQNSGINNDIKLLKRIRAWNTIKKDTRAGDYIKDMINEIKDANENKIKIHYRYSLIAEKMKIIIIVEERT